MGHMSSSFSIISLCIFAQGIVGNILTVAVISCSEKLHTSTYTMIACLAVSDVFSSTMFLLLYYTNIITLIIFCYGINYDIANILLMLMSFQGKLNAGTQLCLLASLRYIAIVKPLRFQIYWNTRKVVIMSVFGWIFVFIFSALCAIFYLYVVSNYTQECNLFIFINITNFIIPTSIFITLHCLKLRALRRSPVLNNKSFVRINVVITLVIVIYILSSASISIERAYGCHRLLYSNHLYQFSNISFLFNSAINPFIYFFASPPILNNLILYVTAFLIG